MEAVRHPTRGTLGYGHYAPIRPQRRYALRTAGRFAARGGFGRAHPPSHGAQPPQTPRGRGPLASQRLAPPLGRPSGAINGDARAETPLLLAREGLARLKAFPVT